MSIQQTIMAEDMSDRESEPDIFADNSDQDKNYAPDSSDFDSSGMYVFVLLVVLKRIYFFTGFS